MSAKVLTYPKTKTLCGDLVYHGKCHSDHFTSCERCRSLAVEPCKDPKKAKERKEILDTMWKISEGEAKKISQALNLKRQRTFIVDIGASFHMFSRRSLSAAEKNTLKDTVPLPINTANDIIYVKKEVRVYVQELGIHVWAYILEGDVALLSLGLLCSEEGGWSYNWNPGQQ